MNQSIITKQIAKEIKLIKYFPQHQLYEISVQWSDSSEPVLKYLPEHHLIPYAIKETTIPEHFIKVLDSSEEEPRDLSLSKETRLDKSQTQGKIQLAPEKSLEEKETTIDYDEFVRVNNLKRLQMTRNLSVLRHCNNPSVTKKRIS